VDRLLASYSFDERSLPQTANLENALRPDFDLLDSDIGVEKAISAREQSRDEQMKAVTGMLSSDAPDWLKEAADTAGLVERSSRYRGWPLRTGIRGGDHPQTGSAGSAAQ